MAAKFIEERNKRIESIFYPGKEPIKLDHLFYQLEPETLLLYSNLAQDTLAYIRTSYQHSARRLTFQDALETYQINQDLLLNRTPNGLVLPKQELINQYNKIHQNYAKILSNRIDFDKIIGLRFPINIRMIDGTLPNANRPRSSTKPHTDCWAGEPTNTVMIHCPVLGDMRNNGMSLYEPHNNFLKYITTQNDFDINKEFIDQCRKYDKQMSLGNCYLIDSYLLHQTNIGNANKRVVISTAILLKDRVDSDVNFGNFREQEYLDKDIWKNIGTDFSIDTKESFYTMPLHRTDEVTNYYANKYEWCKQSEQTLPPLFTISHGNDYNNFTPILKLDNMSNKY